MHSVTKKQANNKCQLVVYFDQFTISALVVYLDQFEAAAAAAAACWSEIVVYTNWLVPRLDRKWANLPAISCIKIDILASPCFGVHCRPLFVMRSVKSRAVPIDQIGLAAFVPCIQFFPHGHGQLHFLI